MKPHRVLTLVCAFGISAVLAARAGSPAQGSAASAFDWPQWQGPDRSGVSKETGLLQQGPAAGPPVQRVACDDPQRQFPVLRDGASCSSRSESTG